MDKSQVYGVLAVGADPKTTAAQKSNLAIASGALHKASSRTLAIEWIYGSDAQPEIRNPLLALGAWLSFVDTADIPAASIEKAWCKRYSDIKDRTATEATHIWDTISSAMSTSILHLPQLMVRPVSPAVWLRQRVEGDPSSGVIEMDMRCPLQREEHLQWIEDRLAEHMWTHVATHEANSGLWSGEGPLMEPTKKIHHRLMVEGRIQEAMALQAAVTHKIWCASRATDDPLFMQCPRCGDPKETLLRRHWFCPDLGNCRHPAVRGTQHLIPEAIKGVEDCCLLAWLRANGEDAKT